MKRSFDVTVGGRPRRVAVEEQEGGVWRVAVDGRERTVEPRVSAAGRYTWLEGTQVVSAHVEAASGKLSVELRGEVVAVEVADARPAVASSVAAARAAAVAHGPVTVRAPIPGRVVKVLVSVGQAVKAGQGVVVIEAMKMENEIRSPRDAAVTAVSVAEGQAVEAAEELIVLG